MFTLEHRSRVFVNFADVRYLLFCLHVRAAYSTAISAAQACFYSASNLTYWHHQITIDINLHTDLDIPLRPLWYSCLTAPTTLLTMVQPLSFFSLDLSAAFDTIDHPILLHRLAHSFGVSGSLFTWVQSYLTGRSQVVRLGSHSSNPTLVSLAYPSARSLGHLYSTFTPLRSPTSLKPTIYNTNMLMTHNCSWLSPQVMCMLKYPLLNLVCHHCKPGSVPIV